jgi:hypothetical protein
MASLDPRIAAAEGLSPSQAAALLEETLEALVQEHSAGALADRVVAARRDYEERRGRVFEDEKLWEAWSQAFLEWYVVERVADDDATFPPAARNLRAATPLPEAAGDGAAASGVPDSEELRRGAIRAWLTSHRSLFEVKALHAGRVELLDLLGGAAFSVAEPRAMHGVAVGDVAELRLIGFAGDVLFGRTFLFHPEGTRDAIVAYARRVMERGGNRREVMDGCAALRVRCERYRHVAAVRLYEAAAEGKAGAGIAGAAGPAR